MSVYERINNTLLEQHNFRTIPTPFYYFPLDTTESLFVVPLCVKVTPNTHTRKDTTDTQPCYTEYDSPIVRYTVITNFYFTDPFNDVLCLHEYR